MNGENTNSHNPPDEKIVRDRAIRLFTYLRELTELNAKTTRTIEHGTRRWAYYTLNIPTEMKIVPTPQTEEEKILEYVQVHHSIKRAECQQLLGITGLQARYLLQKMRKNDLLHLDKKGRGARYILPKK